MIILRSMYYQWVMCAAIFMVGLIIQLYLFAVPPTCDWPQVANCTLASHHKGAGDYISGRADAYSVRFIPMAALGGALWATGNTLSVPVINLIGLSLGLLIWGSANMLMGWATGVFGLFVGYEHRDHLHDPTLNYVGVALACVALACYTQVKSDTRQGGSDSKPTTTRPLSAAGLSQLTSEGPDIELLQSISDVGDAASSSGPCGGGGGGAANRKLLGVVMAILAGESSVGSDRECRCPSDAAIPCKRLDVAASSYSKQLCCRLLGADCTSLLSCFCRRRPVREHLHAAKLPDAQQPRARPADGLHLLSLRWHLCDVDVLVCRLLLLHARLAPHQPAAHVARHALGGHVGSRAELLVRRERRSLRLSCISDHHLRAGDRLGDVGRLRLWRDPRHTQFCRAERGGGPLPRRLCPHWRVQVKSVQARFPRFPCQCPVGACV